MNIQQPKIDLRDTFELYLEGVKVDFLNMSISETEGGVPAASITFPSNHGALRLLPGTIVQIFGYYQQEDKTFLLFEGEVTGINFQKTDSTKVVVIKAISLLGAMIKAKFRPSDAIITTDMKDATGIQASDNIVFNKQGKGGSIGPTTLEDMPKIKNKKSTTRTGSSKDVGLSSLGGLTDEFRHFLAEDQPGGKGDFIPMLQQFNLYFERNDLFYGLKSLAYKFGRTIFASPNPGLSNKVKTDLFQEALNKLKSSGISDVFSESPYTLMQVLVEFQRYLHYSFISPANYTACRPFYLNQSVTEWEPLRMIYLPRLETGPPALCNIFFPEQVSSFTYSREMMGEPTRIVGKATIPLLKKVNEVIDYSPIATYPSLEFDSELIVGNFTTEETYRGINYKIISYPNLHSDLISKLKTNSIDGKQTTKGNEILAKDMESGEIGNLIRPFAYMDFLDLKYRQRQTSINSEWSPYRMIGLPGMMLDPDGVSIVGIIFQMETNISAQGSATTRVTFRNTRLVHDKEFEKTIFSKIPIDNSKGNEKYIIHDLTNDGMMSNNELLYDPDLYSFENIGKDVYTYIAHGMLSTNEGFLAAKNNKGIFDYSNDSLESNDLSIPIHPRRDNSVLNFLPMKDGAYNFEIPESYNKKTEIRNTYLLYKAISELRKEYEAKKIKKIKGKEQYDMPQAYAYMYAINRRNVITKDLYFNFIGAKPSRKLQIEDAHDAKIIFQGGAQELRNEILDRADVQYTKVITSTEAEKEGIRNRIRKDKKNLSKKTNGQPDASGDTLLAIVRIQHPTYSLKHAEGVRNDLKKEIETLRTNISEAQTELNNLGINTTPRSDVKDEELYKPYNMTRRMHVVLAFKDTIDILVNSNKSKLTVTK